MNEVPTVSELIGNVITLVFLVFVIIITYDSYQKFKKPYDNE